MENILTFVIYMTVYGIGVGLFHFADISGNNRKKKSMIALGIIILSVFAGIRGLEVGTDTLTTINMYEVNNYEIISQIADNSIIYNIISLPIAFFGLGSRTFLAIVSAINITMVSVCAYKIKKRVPIAFTMAIFLLLYFQLSFNWIRQSVATAALLLGVLESREGNRRRAIVLFVAGVLFHASAIFGILLYLAAYFCTKVKNIYYRVLIIAITIGIITLIMSQWVDFMLILIRFGILPRKYIGYINVFTGNFQNERYLKWFGVGKKIYVEYVARVLLFVIPYLALRKRKENEYNDNYRFFGFCLLLSIMIYSAGIFVLNSAYVNRITYYMDYTGILYLAFAWTGSGYANGAWQTKKTTVSLRNIAIVSLCVFYNIWLYYVLGWHATVPYYTSLL